MYLVPRNQGLLVLSESTVFFGPLSHFPLCLCIYASKPTSLPAGAEPAEGEEEAKTVTRDVKYLKEVVVAKDPPVVHVFDIVEHGRRFYRTLAFSSDAALSLVSRPPSGVSSPNSICLSGVNQLAMPSFLSATPVFFCFFRLEQHAASCSLLTPSRIVITYWYWSKALYSP